MTHFEEHFGAFLRGHGIEHFTPRELCDVGRLAGGVALEPPPCELWPNILPTVRVVEWVRQRLRRPVIMNSGYRDLMYNRAVGSTDGSMHVRFRALDIRVPGVTPTALRALLETHPDAATFGLGLYPTFVHVDVRGARARW